MRSRTRLLVSLALTFVGGCSTMPTAPTVSQRVPSSDLYFIWKERVHVDRDYLDRYACRDGSTLTCQCGSLAHGMCDCSC
jgi:hypothetical protein